MTAPPLVSIIVPCHRAHSTIAETVHGVLQQSLVTWELILSPDDGVDYLSFLAGQGIEDARIRQHPPGAIASGHVSARTRGMALAGGEYIADLDADDVWQPDRLSRLLPLAQAHGAAQDVLECFDSFGTLGYSAACDGAIRLLAPADVMGIDFPFHLIVHRRLLGGVWFDEDLSAPDAIRAAVLAAKAPLPLLGEALLRYRVHDRSMSQSQLGGRKMDSAYRQILARLAHGDGYGLPDADRAAVIAGFQRKRALNLRHMAAQRRIAATPPFIAWRLAQEQPVAVSPIAPSAKPPGMMDSASTC
jgi:glycosyltransferase involved in cell wall biosynthesis